ncbi:MAG: NAD(P)-dependent oxidoreductase [Muribaculaceae bacterium]|nr:NAD(P)-dependent oxidoreductase [Muribaculaceae bacterium]
MKTALLTGASGLLGSYLVPKLGVEYKVVSLQRRDADVECDLSVSEPRLEGRKFNLVVHAAGTEVESDALAVNLEGTRRLLKSLEANPPDEFVFVSSWEVYSPDAGEDVGESRNLWASTKCGQSKALAEGLLSDWCRDHGVLLTVIRPARMLGKGVKGEMARLFNDVVSGRYIHVRDNDARLSIVCASDVAEAVNMLHSIGGIYNITDGRGVTWLELADAMSANCGQMKRQTFLPRKWASLAWHFASWLPPVKASLDPEVLARRGKTLVLSDAAVRSVLGERWKPFPTLEVLARTCRDYPYID